MGVVQWCTDLPHLVHLLTFLSLLGYVCPPRVSLPCYASFVTASELGCAVGFVDNACEGWVRV